MKNFLQIIDIHFWLGTYTNIFRIVIIIIYVI